jgi:hypothetical protein
LNLNFPSEIFAEIRHFEFEICSLDLPFKLIFRFDHYSLGSADLLLVYQIVDQFASALFGQMGALLEVMPPFARTEMWQIGRKMMRNGLNITSLSVYVKLPI